MESFRDMVLTAFRLAFYGGILVAASAAGIKALKAYRSRGARPIFKMHVGYRGVRRYFVGARPGHIMVYGRTGAGKSNTAKVLAMEFSRKVPVLVLDWAGEYELENFQVLVPGRNFALNPIKPYTRGGDHVDFIVDLFGDSFGFTEPQRFMFRLALREALERRREPVISDVMEELDSLPVRSYYDHEIKMAIRRRVAPLTEGLAGLTLDVPGGLAAEELFSESVILDLGVFRNTRIKKLIALLILKLLYDYATGVRGITGGISHCTVIEEAWATIPYRRLDREPSIGERLFAELRKYGECIVAVSQSPAETAWSISKNAGVVVIHRMLSRDLELLGLDALDTESLSVGEAYVVQGGRIDRVRIRPLG